MDLATGFLAGNGDGGDALYQEFQQQQAATIMIDELSSNLRELTGRGRYRAWAVM